MSDGSASPAGPDPAAADGPHGWRGRVAGAQRDLDVLWRRLSANPHVARAMRVQDVYSQAGGGMVAAGLSFYALFTVVPSLLLLMSLLGFVIESAATRQAIVDAVVAQVPPLEDVARTVVDGMVGGAQAGTIVGLVGAIWGASGFYGSLQDAMSRLFPGPVTRDVIQTRLRGLASVVVLMGGILVVVVAGLAVPFVVSLADLDLGELAVLVTPLTACAFATLACLIVYVLVPANGPGARTAMMPALLAGVAIGLLTTLFGVVAPYLVRNAAALGLLGAVFVALVWFDLVFQVLLYGGALARTRCDGAESGGSPAG